MQNVDAMERIIRQARADDGGAIAGIYAPYVINTPITFEEQAPDAVEMSRRVEETLKTFPFLIAQIDGTVVGYAYAGAHRTRASYRWSVDVAIYLGAAYRRLGIGKALYEALLPLLAAQGFIMAYAGITLPNGGSVGLHEAMGFTPVGVYRNVGFKLGSWRDVGWWERQLASPPENPAGLVPWTDMPRFEPQTFGGNRP
jgi:L-amino acid N-acyltransferase YncA